MTTINVTRTEVLKTGATKGKPWTLYQVFGSLPDGSPLPGKVKSFDQMPTGLVRVDLDEDSRESGAFIAKVPRNGTTRPSKPNGGGAPDADRIAQLESRVERLERQMRAIITNAEIPLP